MFNWKKLLLGTALSAFCLGLFPAGPACATTDNPKVSQVSEKIEYLKISPNEYAFRDKRTGNSMYVVEDQTQGHYIVSCVEETYKDPARLEEQWQGYKVGRSVIANVGYVNHCMATSEVPFLREIASHSMHWIEDFADGTGTELPNHVEFHHIFNMIDGRPYLAAHCEVNNLPAVNFQVFGGKRLIHGEGVPLRFQPADDSDVLTSIKKDELVYVFGYTLVNFRAPLPNGWAFIRRENGDKGFIKADFLLPRD